MFNNAGIGVSGEMRDLTLDDWRTVIDINLMGVIYGTAAAYAAMLAAAIRPHREHRVAGGLIFPPGLAPYDTAKAGVVALSAALRSGSRRRSACVSASCVQGSWRPRSTKTRSASSGQEGGAGYDQAADHAGRRDAARAILRGVERNQATSFPRPARACSGG